jgi:hypothetical protein
MAKQNFAVTAMYFERRAEKLPSGGRKKQLEETAAHYQAKAEACGHHKETARRVASEPPAIPPRRRKLMELFRAYNAEVELS